MRLGLHRTIPTIVALLLAYGISIGNVFGEPPSPEEARVEAESEEYIPVFQERVLDKIADDVTKSVTASNPQQGLQSYLFSDKDVKSYLNAFAGHPSTSKDRSFSEGKQIVEHMRTLSETTLAQIGQLDEAQIVNRKMLYSDEHEVFKTLVLYVDGSRKEAPVTMELTFVELNGSFKLLLVRSDQNF